MQFASKYTPEEEQEKLEEVKRQLNPQDEVTFDAKVVAEHLASYLKMANEGEEQFLSKPRDPNKDYGTYSHPEGHIADMIYGDINKSLDKHDFENLAEMLKVFSTLWDMAKCSAFAEAEEKE